MDEVHLYSKMRRLREGCQPARGESQPNCGDLRKRSSHYKQNNQQFF